jgi:hypothetical protein
VKALIQSDSADSGSKLYQVEITGSTESALDQIKKDVERNTKGTQEELVGDMSVSSL